MKKRIISMVLTLIMLASIGISGYALEPKLSVSSAYASSIYYTRLKKVTLTGNQRTDLINVAKSQLGYHEGDSKSDLGGGNTFGSQNYTEYNRIGSQGNDWCAYFVSWCARQAGIPTKVIKTSASATAADFGCEFHWKKTYSYKDIKPGDLIIFDYEYIGGEYDGYDNREPASEHGDHVGIVIDVDSSHVYTIEGNSSKCVKKNEYLLTCSDIKGYAVPNYTSAVSHKTHTYTGTYYETAHPHKEYQKCTCGAIKYTGNTKKLTSCETCYPVEVSSKYNAVLPFKAYLKGTSTVYPYTSANLSKSSGGEIWDEDECTITKVYTNGACKVTYPVSGGTKTAYTNLSNFIGSTSATLDSQKVTKNIATYIRPSTQSSAYGKVSSGSTVYKLGASGNMTQIFYSVNGSYRLAWVLTSDLTPIAYDTRFNPYCPIDGYPCATSDFDVYKSDHSTVAGEIYTSDFCTINAVYADGWCKVTYPTDSGEKTAYSKLSNFIFDTNATHTKYKATAKITVYSNKAATKDLGWWISSGDTFYVVGASGTASQVMYPIDAQYGGGYKLGWVKTSSLPKTTYTVTFDANGGKNAPTAQNKTHGTALTLSSTVPTRAGYTFLGWATSSSATAAEYKPGASYTKDAKITLYAVWKLNKYEISYDANGGTDAPSAQTKTHGTDITLSASVPSKSFMVTYDANGGSVGIANCIVDCSFLGWATSPTAAAAAYQPEGKLGTNANTTLYAVWLNDSLSQYEIPTREGYVFDGWYTAKTGGTQVTVSTEIASDMTLYAHWSVEDNGSGGGNTTKPSFFSSFISWFRNLFSKIFFC